MTVRDMHTLHGMHACKEARSHARMHARTHTHVHNGTHAWRLYMRTMHTNATSLTAMAHNRRTRTRMHAVRAMRMVYTCTPLIPHTPLGATVWNSRHAHVLATQEPVAGAAWFTAVHDEPHGNGHAELLGRMLRAPAAAPAVPYGHARGWICR